MVFERLLSSGRVGRFMEYRGIPTTQFVYLKGCDALLLVSNTPQNASESGQEARIVQIDVSSAFDADNHQEVLYISTAPLVL